MTFRTIRAALHAARWFHDLHGARGYRYKARAFRGATEMTFHTIRAALCAARHFHNLHGSRGYVYRAEPCLFDKGFHVRVMSSRGVFLTFI